MYATLILKLILKLSKCNMFKFVYKIINKMYFILYQVLLFYIKLLYSCSMCIKLLILWWNWWGIDFLGIGIELELTFLKTKGIGIDSGIDKKELEWNLELIKKNWPQLCPQHRWQTLEPTGIEPQLDQMSHLGLESKVIMGMLSHSNIKLTGSLNESRWTYVRI